MNYTLFAASSRPSIDVVTRVPFLLCSLNLKFPFKKALVISSTLLITSGPILEKLFNIN